MKERAISDDDKAFRKKAILRAASSLLAERHYHDISIDRIARKSGLAKGTIFLYFKTKEELFLQLQMTEYDAWFEDVNMRLVKLSSESGRPDIASFVKIIISSLRAHPLMARMAPLIHVILEHNIDYKTAAEFKRFLLTRLTATGAVIEKCLPFLKKSGGTCFLLDLHVLMLGVMQIAEPAPLITKVIEGEGMSVFRVQFESKLENMLMTLLTGMENTGK